MFSSYSLRMLRRSLIFDFDWDKFADAKKLKLDSCASGSTRLAASAVPTSLLPLDTSASTPPATHHPPPTATPPNTAVMPQDMPPTGGYEPVQYRRNLPVRGFRPAWYLAAVAGVMTYGFYRVGQGIREHKYGSQGDLQWRI